MAVLGGTTSLLLLSVFAVVNVSVLVLRRDKSDNAHFKAGKVLPVIGVAACLWLVLPFSSGRGAEQYALAGGLLVLGVLLWLVTFIDNKRRGVVPTEKAAAPEG